MLEHTLIRRHTSWPQTSSCSSCSRMACKKALRSWLEDFWSNIPAWMTFWSTFSLYLAAAKIFSSTLLTVQRRRTRTSFCWPMRWALSWAWRSWADWEEETESTLKFKCLKRWCSLEVWASRHGCCKGELINLKDIYSCSGQEANTVWSKGQISQIRWMKGESRLNVD